MCQNRPEDVTGCAAGFCRLISLITGRQLIVRLFRHDASAFHYATHTQIETAADPKPI